jgi:hypothetical protein
MSTKPKTILIGVVLLIVINWLVFAIAKPYVFSDSLNGVVKEKYIKDHRFFVVVDPMDDSSQNETLINKDITWRFKYNSSDIQNNLEIGKQYNFNVLGVRRPMFSAYRNVCSYTEVKD